MNGNNNRTSNGKKRMEFIYTLLGIIISMAIIVGGFWAVYARPKVSEQSRIEITNWWDQSGTFKCEKIADAVCEKKVAQIEDKIDRIYRMNLRRLPGTERREFEIPEDTINP